MNKKIIDVSKVSVTNIPYAEDDFYEFKSSLTDWNKLKDKLQKAASGFVNSGGGYFIVGINDETGEFDGGISERKGDTPIFDWIDTVMSQIEPTPSYSVKLLCDAGGRGIIEQDKVVLIVAINEGNIGPYMAPDYRYYIRAGKHTVPARNFIVEAIRAKRYNAKPKLTHVFRLKPDYVQVLQLGIVAITHAPAINVTIMVSPLPKNLQSRIKDFPIEIPVIDIHNPFFFDVALYADSSESFGDNVRLQLTYSDLSQNYHQEDVTISVSATPPLVIGNRDNKFLEVFKSIEKAIIKLSKSVE